MENPLSDIVFPAANKLRTILHLFFRSKALLTTCLWLLICLSIPGQTLKVQVYNKTGQNVDSLFIGKKFFGHLAEDNSSESIAFETFNFDTGFPREAIFGIINKTRIRQLNFSFCGTEWHTETTGDYIFDLMLRKYEGEEYFYLDYHQSKSK